MPISPNQGPTSGGTTVTITGVNLAGATAVHFGSRTATITANTPTLITAFDPAGCGVVDVNVTTAGGTSNSLSFFYISPPIAVSLGPGSGPTAGTNTVTINGYGLSTATTVSFGSNTATPTVISDSRLSVVVPGGSSSGSVDVTVTTTGGTTAPLSYAYVDAPTLVSLTPTSGSTSGGTSVTVNGTGLSSTTAVTFGGTTASFAVLNSTTLVAVTPSGTGRFRRCGRDHRGRQRHPQRRLHLRVRSRHLTASRTHGRARPGLLRSAPVHRPVPSGSGAGSRTPARTASVPPARGPARPTTPLESPWPLPSSPRSYPTRVRRRAPIP